MSDIGSVTLTRDDSTVHATAYLAGAQPANTLAAFLDSASVSAWWGGQLAVEATPHGRYVVTFRQLGQTMRGQVLEYRPGELLVFSRSWDHEPDLSTRRVEVRVASSGDGTRLDLVHGSYADAEPDRADAPSHAEGWAYFLPRLVEHLTP